MRDLHVHTTYSDGRNTPEEMVRAAIALDMTAIGFSDHAFVSFDPSYCMPREKLPAYRAEISALKAKYAGRIQIFCGIEQDLFSDDPAEGYDYVIGSLHYAPAGPICVPVDASPEALLEGVRQHFGGDIYAMTEAYYDALSRVAEQLHPDFIGHFDLVTKFNEGGCLFDESHPRYIAAWQRAADKLLEAGIPFEINTGAISRGYRTAPYPAAPIRGYLAARGGRFLLSSDSHRADTLCFGFQMIDTNF